MRYLAAALLVVLPVGAFAHDADGLSVPIDPEHRVVNIGRLDRRQGGNCYWASLETVALHHGLARLEGLSQEHTQPTWTDDVLSVLDIRRVRYLHAESRDGHKPLGFLVHQLARHQGAVVVIPGHAMVVVDVRLTGSTLVPYRVPTGDGHYEVRELVRWVGTVKVIDNASWDQSVQDWPLQAFMEHWTGEAIVLLPDRPEPLPMPHAREVKP